MRVRVRKYCAKSTPFSLRDKNPAEKRGRGPIQRISLVFPKLF
jgi:hypothetical protein